MVKTALITGAAKRVGKTIALHLAKNGYDIVFTYKNSQNQAQSLVEEIQTLGRSANAIQADFESPQIGVDAIVKHRGNSPLDLLVHNAGIFEPDDPDHLLEQSRRMMAVHFETPLLLVRAFEKSLRRCNGRVIHITDILAERPWPRYSAYCASKAALVNLIKSQARKLAPEATVNGISPGVVDWPGDFSEEMKEKYIAKVPMARAGTPLDVAKMVYFLATDGSYMTGQVIKLDGGRSLV